MRTIDHWIAGKHTEGRGERTSPVFNPATGQQQAELRLGSPADVESAIAAARDAFPDWSQTSISQRTKVMFAFREVVNSRAHELAELITDEHGKVLSDALGEVQRGLEVVEFACGIPSLLKGDYSDQVSTDVDTWSFREPLGVARRHHAVQLPGDGPDVDVPGRDRLWEHLRAQAQRARPLRVDAAGTRCGRRPVSRTGCSTWCTATRSRSTRSWTLRTWRRFPSWARPPSRGTSTSGVRRTASGSRRSAVPRTTRSSFPTPTWSSRPTTSPLRHSGRPVSGAWRSRQPSRWATSATDSSEPSPNVPVRSGSAVAGTATARWVRS